MSRGVSALATEIDSVLDARGLTLDEIEARMERAYERVLARRAEQYEPLSSIFRITPKAASARLTRDPNLRRIGVQIGSRVLFQRSAVENYYRARNSNGGTK